MKKFHLSTYISITTGLLVTGLILVISSILYFNFNKSMTLEFEDKIRAECREITQVLAHRFHQVENRLKELSQDSTIRATLMLGETQQLQEHINKKYNTDKNIHFYLTPVNSKRIFHTSGMKALPEKIDSFLSSPANTKNFDITTGIGSTYWISLPIFRQKKQIGTAAGIYRLNNDRKLVRSINRNKSSTIIIKRDNQKWNLLSGEKIENISIPERETTVKGLSYGTLDGETIAVVGKPEFPDLIYISNLDRVANVKSNVLTLVLYLSFFVLVFVVIISYFLSRLLVLPLSLLSRQSLEVADGRSDLTQKMFSSNVIEVEQLMSSLSTMVRQLKKTEKLKRYQQLFEGVTDPILIFDFSGKFIEVNQIALNRFGFKFKEFKHMHLTDIIPEEYHEKILNILHDLFEKKHGTVFETEILTHKKETVSVECHARKISFKDQEVVLSVVRDITDRKKAEEKLIRSEERLSLALEVSLAGAWEFNIKTKEFSFDINLYNTLGYSKEEHPKKITDILKIIDPNHLDHAKQKFVAFATGKRTHYEDDFLVTTKNGKKRWVHNRARAVQFFTDQKPKMIIGTAIDISELKWTEQALRENEERYRTILDNRNIGYFEVDLGGNLFFFNDALCAIMGYRQDELLGMNFSAYTDKNTSKKIKQKYNSIFETGRPLEKFNYAITTKEGVLRELETSVSLIKYSGEKPVGFRGLIIDITDRKTAEQENKKLETQLRQAHKMEAIGTLAGGIAHDFNNILSGIFGYSQLAEVNIDNPLKAKGHIQKIIKGAKRAAGLTQQILTFSRQSEDEKLLVDISVVVKEALRLLRSSIPTTIEINEHINSKATALADPTQIHQIIMNLCTNAYHAMRSKGGTLTVNLMEVEFFAQDNVSTINSRSGKYLKLIVSDTGHGMNEETMRKVFDPYFTTKPVSEGTGLGLALVYGIVDDHDGFIKVNSVIDKGSVFQIFLPIAQTTAMADHQTSDGTPVSGGTEMVMVVDDEDSILLSTKEYLEDFGYTVSEFSNGTLALEAFRQNADQFDLIITDMTMPKMTGDELSRKILEIKNNIPIILCTGYSEKISKKEALEIGIKKYLQKPIDSRNLLMAVRDVLDKTN